MDFSKTEEISDIKATVAARGQIWKTMEEVVWPGSMDATKAEKKRQEKTLNQQKRTPTFQEGDKVVAIDALRSSKWDPVYEGPYSIAKVHEGGSYTLIDELGEQLE